MNGKALLTGRANIELVSANDLCRIIKVCSQSGVTSFHFGDIHLDFGSKSVDQLIATNPVLAETKPDDAEAQKISEESQKQLSLEQLRQYVDELKLSDPLAYEQFVEGEIGDVGGGQA